MSLFRNEREALKKICATLAQEHKINIVLDDSGEGAHTKVERGKVTEVRLGVKNLADFGMSYHVGLVLHEIAHVRYSPAMPPGFAKPSEQMIVNMVEDERIEHLIDNEYAGANYYLGSLHYPAVEAMEDILAKSFAGQRFTDPVAYLSERDPIKREGVKRYMLERVLAYALLTAKGYATRYTTTGNSELDAQAGQIAAILKQAQGASAADIATLATQCLQVLKEYLPAEEKQGESELHVEKMLRAGGVGVSEPQSHGYMDRKFIEADQVAQPLVARLKKKLIARLRENQHQRYTHGKRKGLLDKRALARVARKNYRVYRKREEVKGKEYSVALVVDTSGSMFNWSDRIGQALESTMLLTRTFRSMGYPVSITLYGYNAATVLHARDRCVPDDIQARANSVEGYTYYSSDNQTQEGIKLALANLKRDSNGKQPLLIVITDGGLRYEDISTSKKMLDRAQRNDGVQSLIFYVESDLRRILKDETRERTISNVDELIPAITSLAEKLTA